MDSQKQDKAAPPANGGAAVVRIPLRDRRGEVRDYVTVDEADAPLVEPYRWFLNTQGYAVRNVPKPGGGQRTLPMHRAILGLDFGDPREGEHISRYKLDNRRSNLLVVTHAQNSQNRRKSAGTSSWARGVSLRKGKKVRPWHAYGKADGKMTHLGFYDTQEEAAEVARAWRREHMPFATD